VLSVFIPSKIEKVFTEIQNFFGIEKEIFLIHLVNIQLPLFLIIPSPSQKIKTLFIFYFSHSYSGPDTKRELFHEILLNPKKPIWRIYF